MFFRTIGVSAIIALFCIHSASAQLQLGLKAGANANSSDLTNFDFYAPAFNGGLFAAYPVTKFADVRLELAYNQLGGGFKGYREKETLTERSAPTLVFHAVEVPLLFQVTLPSTKQSNSYPSLFVGASYAYSIKTVEHYTESFEFRDQKFEAGRYWSDVTDDYERHIFGVIGGLAYNFHLIGKPVQADLRYRYHPKKVQLPSGEDRFATISLNVAVALFELNP